MEKRINRKKQILLMIFILAICYLLINFFVICFYYQNYKNSIDILAEMIMASGESGIDVASEILKENNLLQVEQGRAILNSYGYLDSRNNTLFFRFLKESSLTAIITFLIFIILIFGLMIWLKLVKRSEVMLYRQIEQNLINFRENHTKVIFKDTDSVEQQKIKYQLETLGNQLQLLREEARAEKEGTKELVSDISHQLKTPFAALDTCFSVLLRENLSDVERIEFSNRCRNALDGLEVLLQSLLQISRLEAGLIQIEKSQLPLLETILMAVNRIYPKASEKNIELCFDYDESIESLSIMQDKKWLSEAIINVLDNAVKYSPVNSEISIRLQKRNNFIRIEIEDCGIGIPSEEYHKVFQRFFRGRSMYVKEESGSGIGLYLAREIIENHHGTISVSSNLSRSKLIESRYPGSSFLIQLPINE